MPRRASKEVYNDVEDEKRGSDIVLSADENFEDIQVSLPTPSPSPYMY